MANIFYTIKEASALIPDDEIKVKNDLNVFLKKEMAYKSPEVLNDSDFDTSILWKRFCQFLNKNVIISDSESKSELNPSWKIELQTFINKKHK